MSNIDKQQIREEVQEWKEIYCEPADAENLKFFFGVESLLDELEAKDRQTEEQANIIARKEKWIKGIEAAMITATDRAEAAEKRNIRTMNLLNAATPENVWEIIGRLKTVIIGDYRSEDEIAAAGKGE